MSLEAPHISFCQIFLCLFDDLDAFTWCVYVSVEKKYNLYNSLTYRLVTNILLSV